MARVAALQALAAQHQPGDAHAEAAALLASGVEVFTPEELVQHFARKSELFGALLATASTRYVREVLCLLEERRVPLASLLAAARCDWDCDAARAIAWRLRRKWVCGVHAPVRTVAEHCLGDPPLLRALAQQLRARPVGLARLLRYPGAADACAALPHSAAAACAFPPCVDRFGPCWEGCCALPLGPERVHTSHSAADVAAAAERLGAAPVLGVVALASPVPGARGGWLVAATEATVELVDLEAVPDPSLPQLADPAVLKVCLDPAPAGLRSVWVLARGRPVSCVVPAGPWLRSWWATTGKDYPLCDEEDASDWSRRPLRKAQRHNAALRAFLLVLAAHHLCASSPAGRVTRRHVLSLFCACRSEPCGCAHRPQAACCVRALFDPARLALLESLRPAAPSDAEVGSRAPALRREDAACVCGEWWCAECQARAELARSEE